MQTRDLVVPPMPHAGAQRAQGIEKPMRVVLKMRDAADRPIILTLADALATMDNAGIEPIGDLRGGATSMSSYRDCLGAMTWIEGETESTRFRIAIPTSGSFSGWNFNNRRVERPITMFNGVTIRRDGFLRLAKDFWIDRVEFDIPHFRFTLTAVELRIAALVNEYLRSLGHPLPANYLDYAALGRVQWTGSLQPMIDFVWLHWHREAVNSAPPSRETIAATLDALVIRERSRVK
jgi:hypothetical protein